MKLEIKDEYFDEEELTRTPERYKGFMEELESNNDFSFTCFKNPGYDQLIILKAIDYASICSHHLLPFTGQAHVGYVPRKKICGISKLARVVDKFASKPQLQERMTNEIADFLNEELEPLGVMVVVEGAHECMRIRGVKKLNSVMITSALRGEFRSNAMLRDEFMRLIRV